MQGRYNSEAFNTKYTSGKVVLTKKNKFGFQARQKQFGAIRERLTGNTKRGIQITRYKSGSTNSKIKHCKKRKLEIQIGITGRKIQIGKYALGNTHLEKQIVKLQTVKYESESTIWKDIHSRKYNSRDTYLKNGNLKIRKIRSWKYNSEDTSQISKNRKIQILEIQFW